MKKQERIALEQAIAILQKTNMHNNIVVHLNNILKQSIIKSDNKWTSEKIIEVIDDWVATHHCNPSHKDFQYKGLPKPITIENNFGMKLSEFLDLYYPYNKAKNKLSKYRRDTVESLIEDFITQYNAIKPTGSKEYNTKRKINSPTWNTVASYCNVSTWRDLIIKLNLCTSNLNRSPYAAKELNIQSEVGMYIKLEDMLNKGKTK